MFGAAGHDAGALAEEIGPAPAAGFFSAGEIGPVGMRSFVHGFSTSVALFGA
jgi:small ligand-binding sensory domain FIST